MDNEPRNQQVVNYNKELIKMGHKVCIWPKNIEEKDRKRLERSALTCPVHRSLHPDLEKKIRFIYS